MSNTAIWLVRSDSLALGEVLREEFEAELFQPWLDDSLPQAEQFKNQFFNFSRWIFVGAAGIAVRFLSSLPDNKLTDPSVVVLDEGCNFAIALLGGHEGGANELAHRVAARLSCTPVITTATESLKPLTIGLGCRKGVSAASIAETVQCALGSRTLAEVRQIATVDLKKNEPGLLAFAQANRIPIRIFPAADIAARNWVSQPSPHVREVTGADGICEPCALMSSPKSRLIVTKFTANGVAVAIAEDARPLREEDQRSENGERRGTGRSGAGLPDEEGEPRRKERMKDDCPTLQETC